MNATERWERATAEGIHVRQGREEFIEACGRIAEAGPLGNMVEIGSLCGGSAFVLAGLLSKGSKIILVDACDRGPKVLATLDKTVGALRDEGFQVTLVKALSENRETLWAVTEALNDKQIGLCHIDGGHAATTVLADWRNYAVRFLVPGGWAVFHDVVTPGGVRVAWEAILGLVDKGGGWQPEVVGGQNWSRANFWATGIGLLRRLR